LLAVPVFYSLFEDIIETTLWQRVSQKFSGIGRMFRPIRERLANISTLFTRGPKKAEADSAGKTKDAYVD
jgi:hypothetical protein